MANPQAGDKVGYTAKWLRSVGAYTGSVPFRRGTFVGMDASMSKQFGRVRWDDIEDYIADGSGQFSDPEYVADVRQNGSLINVGNIAKVGSTKFHLD
jgi:hypothetical protein